MKTNILLYNNRKNLRKGKFHIDDSQPFELGGEIRMLCGLKMKRLETVAYLEELIHPLYVCKKCKSIKEIKND